jgi:hypothetical protein
MFTSLQPFQALPIFLDRMFRPVLVVTVLVVLLSVTFVLAF